VNGCETSRDSIARFTNVRLRAATVELPFAALKYRIFGHPRFLLRGPRPSPDRDQLGAAGLQPETNAEYLGWNLAPIGACFLESRTSVESASRSRSRRGSSDRGCQPIPWPAGARSPTRPYLRGGGGLQRRRQTRSGGGERWGSNVSVLLGNGDGTFQAAVNYGAGSDPVSVAVGDFNGDGKPDRRWRTVGAVT